MARPARFHQPPDPDEIKARKILAALNRLERAERSRRYTVNFIWLLTLILVLAIILVIVANRDRFLSFWTHLSRPDSLLGN